jgi:hypothetical protein
MAINTLITIRDAIQAFVDGHGQLQAVGFGADDKRAPYLTEQELFPVLYVAPIDVEVGRAHNTHRLRVYVYERLNDEDQDEWENANDTSLILRDIRVWWNDYGVDDILIETDPTGTFKTDSELDNLVGYYAEISFQIPSHGRCDVPVNIEPVPPLVCLPANYVVEYADGTPIESGTIPSGGSETIVVPNCEDATYNLDNTEGSTLFLGSIPSGDNETIIAPDGTANVKNTAGTTVATGLVPSGGSANITAPDATVQINGDQVGTVASGGMVNIAVENESGTPLGTFDEETGVWVVPNCQDATAVLRDTDNNILSTTPIASGATENIIAPDALVLNSNNTYQQSIPSGATFVLPDTTYNVYVDGFLENSVEVATLDNETINIVWQ